MGNNNKQNQQTLIYSQLVWLNRKKERKKKTRTKPYSKWKTEKQNKERRLSRPSFAGSRGGEPGNRQHGFSPLPRQPRSGRTRTPCLFHFTHHARASHNMRALRRASGALVNVKSASLTQKRGGTEQAPFISCVSVPVPGAGGLYPAKPKAGKMEGETIAQRERPHFAGRFLITKWCCLGNLRKRPDQSPD